MNNATSRIRLVSFLFVGLPLLIDGFSALLQQQQRQRQQRQRQSHHSGLCWLSSSGITKTALSSLLDGTTLEDPVAEGDTDERTTTTTTASSTGNDDDDNDADAHDDNSNLFEINGKREEDTKHFIYEASNEEKENDLASSKSAIQSQIKTLNQRLDRQEQQIERLISALQHSNSLSNHSESASTPVIPIVPVKAMLFIDGTWLYYSLYGREVGRCQIREKYGYGWYQKYDIAWPLLPSIICQALQDRGWSSTSQRPMEIVRASVFTSYKADTLSTSLRYQLFEDLKTANYDVQQMETVGKSEKCVDIQLAVEMLHYATVADSYDVAILLTGDKDFLPALSRTRQKGRKVALVSMRSGCNRALIESNGIKDYDVVWLEDHLDKLLVPKTQPGIPQDAAVSVFTIAKVLKDFIDESGFDSVSSRDIGRYFQCLNIGTDTLLSTVRNTFGGLGTFVAISQIFDAVDRENSPNDNKEKPDYAYYIKMLPDAEEQMLDIAKKTTFSQQEKDFFATYDKSALKDRQTSYYFTLSDRGELDSGQNALPVVPEIDFASFTVSQLKERCRERGLPTTGVKAVLLERVMDDAEEEKREKKARWDTFQSAPRHAQPSVQRSFSVPSDVASYLKGVLEEYLHAAGGKASSRDIGRYLAVNKSSTGQGSPQMTALRELKKEYGGLSSFINANADLFSRDDEILDDDRAFLVLLKTPPKE